MLCETEWMMTERYTAEKGVGEQSQTKTIIYKSFMSSHAPYTVWQAFSTDLRYSEANCADVLCPQLVLFWIQSHHFPSRGQQSSLHVQEESNAPNKYQAHTFSISFFITVCSLSFTDMWQKTLCNCCALCVSVRHTLTHYTHKHFFHNASVWLLFSGDCLFWHLRLLSLNCLISGI